MRDVVESALGLDHLAPRLCPIHAVEDLAAHLLAQHLIDVRLAQVAEARGNLDDEREAYAREVARLRGLLPRFATRKRWFLEHEGEVFGAVRLGEIDVAAAAGVLICFDGKSGWVALSDLLAP